MYDFRYSKGSENQTKCKISRRQNTTQLQLDFISTQPVGYGPQTVNVLHMVFSPSLEASPLSSCMRPDLDF